MKCKYKKFLKAAYINYEEDYCSNAVLRKTRPPLEEILAPATFEVTLNYADGYYWATFYTSMANYLAPDGVLVYKVNLNGSQFTRINIEDGIINKRQGVVLRSSTSSITLTKTYSKSSDDYSNNSLIGTDYEITNPGNAYGLNYKQSHGLSFYPLSSTGRIKANKAYLIIEDIYLTQWRLVGNSTVHTDEYLTQWKVSGNSVVDNNTILSCGDLGQDGKYHVKISNGVTIFDIPLTEPLRKVNDVADAIEFHSDTEGKALVTRNLGRILMGDRNFAVRDTKYADYKRFLFMTGVKPASNNNVVANGLCSGYNMITNNQTYNINADGTGTAGIGIDTGGYCYVFDPNYNTASDANAIKAANANTEFIYELATPTTELIDVSPFSVSSTDTYTSANVVPFSAFEHTENKEIWSCGEYNPIDGKYHILVQPLGGSIADIALDAPLRKVNDVADTIEFPSDTEGKALITHNLAKIDLGNITYARSNTAVSGKYRWAVATGAKVNTLNILNCKYTVVNASETYNATKDGVTSDSSGVIRIYESEYSGSGDANNIKASNVGYELIYELATPTTKLVDAPQIEEADSYSMVISQGGKAVSWSGFTTE